MIDRRRRFALHREKLQSRIRKTTYERKWLTVLLNVDAAVNGRGAERNVRQAVLNKQPCSGGCIHSDLVLLEVLDQRLVMML